DLVVGIDEIIPPPARTVQPTLDARDFDGLALDVVVLDVAVGAANGERDDGSAGPGDGFDRLVEGDSLGGLAVDLGDDVAGLNPGLIGGAVLQQADDLEAAVVVELNLNADAVEL